jgi:hypothetical protein
MIKDIKNSGDHNFSRRDGFQTLKEAFNDAESAYDQIVTNSLVPKRYTSITWELQTLGDGTEDVKYINFWGHGDTESNELRIGDSPLGSTEKTTIDFSNKTPEQLAGKYLFIYDDVGSVCIWFNLDSANSQPSVIANRYIEVPITAGSSPESLATITSSTLNSDSEFTATYLNQYVMVASVSYGNKTNSVDGNSGLMLTITDGTENINSKYMFLYDAKGNKYHIWWNVNSTGTDPDPDPSNSTPIEVTLDVAETATTVATKTAHEIDLTDEFLASSEDFYVIVKNKFDGSSLGIVDGNTGFSVENLKKGSARPLVRKIQVFYDNDYFPTSFEVVNIE